MRAHVIEDGKIINTIEIERLDLIPGLQLVDADLVGGAIGDDYDGEAGTAQPPAPPVPSEAETIVAYMDAVQQHMDATARAFGYDDLISVVTYAEEPAVARYQAEGQAFRAWRSACWANCEAMLAAVKTGTRPAPTHEELIAELPELGIEYSGPFAQAA
ncbi:hypothetical protein [Massilia sp. BKSP1R2A-1]|uniref:hypothetical protein n=1 Tax=Massilia sp. BKSP1R2A-1 TaxID=3422595 RepID=UPI003D336043